MVLQLPLRYAVDVNGWVQYCSEMFLSMILDGPTPAAVDIVVDIEWDQDCSETFCQSYWMGPQSPLRHAVDDIGWVLSCR